MELDKWSEGFFTTDWACSSALFAALFGRICFWPSQCIWYAIIIEKLFHKFSHVFFSRIFKSRNCENQRLWGNDQRLLFLSAFCSSFRYGTYGWLQENCVAMFHEIFTQFGCSNSAGPWQSSTAAMVKYTRTLKNKRKKAHSVHYYVSSNRFISIRVLLKFFRSTKRVFVMRMQPPYDLLERVPKLLWIQRTEKSKDYSFFFFFLNIRSEHGWGSE